jgi:hypothetical protein
MVTAISSVIDDCLPMAAAMPFTISLALRTTAATLLMRVTALHAFDLAADAFGCGGGLPSQFLHFVGHDCKALAHLSGASGFNGGIEGKQVRLRRNGIDSLGDFANVIRRFAEAFHHGDDRLGFVGRLLRGLARLRGLGRNLHDCLRHGVRRAAHARELLSQPLSTLGLQPGKRIERMGALVDLLLGVRLLLVKRGA